MLRSHPQKRCVSLIVLVVVVTAIVRILVRPSPPPVVEDWPVQSPPTPVVPARHSPPIDTPPPSNDKYWPSYETWGQDGWSFPLTTPAQASLAEQYLTYTERGHENLGPLLIPEPLISNSVTAILRVTNPLQIEPQLKSLKTQVKSASALGTVWLVCSNELPSAVDVVALAAHTGFDIRVRVVTVKGDYDSGSAGASPWVAVLPTLGIQTEWVWVLDHSLVRPASPEYLGSLLHLASTVYPNALLGTHAALLPSNFRPPALNQQTVLCLGTDSTPVVPRVTQPADSVLDTWLLRKEWLDWLGRGDVLLDAPLGYAISQALLKHGNIPTLALAPHRKISIQIDSSACDQIQQAYRTSPSWRASRGLRIHPSALDYRQATLRQAAKNLGTVVFVVDGPDQAAALHPLVCRFDYTVHVILTGPEFGLSGETMADTFERTGCAKVIVHDLDLTLATEATLTSQVVAGVTQLIRVVRPCALVYIQRDKHMLTKALAHLDGMTTPIGLPIGDVQHALWIAHLPVDALRHWHTPDINLVVVTDRRPHALSRLFASAERSYFLGDKVNLVVNLEQSSDRATRMLVNSFQWQHGDKALRHRIRKGGLMPAIVESWYPKNDDDYAVILEDDVEVSPLFYVWAKYSILQYRYHSMANSDLDEFRKRMYGISLYSPRNLELHPAGRRPFHPDNVLLNIYPPRMPYVSQVPCSWGAVYFPEHWREFHEYLTIRLMDLGQDRRLNVTVPNSRSARWKKSWKKYYIELVYLRAYVMLYPNFQEFESFSTNHLETGTHVKTTTKRMSAINSFLVPLMQRDTILSQLPNQRLPDYEGLPVLDLWGYLQTHATLDETAAQWHGHVSACKRRPGRFDPQDILCPFETPPPPEPIRPKRVKFKYAVEPVEYVYTTHEEVVYDPDLDGPKAIDVATMSSDPDDGSILWDDAEIDFIRDLPWMNQLYNPLVSFDHHREDLQDRLRADAELDFD